MGLRSTGCSLAVVAAALTILPAAAARADEILSTCEQDQVTDGVTALSDAVNEASIASAGSSRARKDLATKGVHNYGDVHASFVGGGDAPVPTTYDIHEAKESDGKSGVVPTVGWTAEEQSAVENVEGALPECVVATADIQAQYRVQRGLKTAQSGILGAAYAWNNQGAKKGGELFFTDLMFDHQVYKSLTADQQMQAALGWRSCFPPAGDPNSEGNVVTRVHAMPPEIQAITTKRILFHEFIHGVTHQQEGNDYANWASTEGFFMKPSAMCPQCGSSRFDELRAKLFAPGNTTPESQTIANIRSQMAQISASDPDARAKYCALYGQLSDFMKSQGVPMRWPGDFHALDDKDEYVTILIENAVMDPKYTFGPQSPYSPTEQAWVKQWWQSTFGAPLGDCGSAVAQNPNLGPIRDAALGYFGGF